MSFRWLAGIVATSLISALSVHAATAHEVVRFDGFPRGTIVIKTHERHLYYALGGGQALRFPVGVGMAGQRWTGVSYIDRKYVKPAWAPPEDIKRENPRLPDVIEGGSPNNPMGVAAMTLSGTDYAIHGTNRPSSIGRFVSHGCIRMYNRDITELYDLVSVGTRVVVLE